MRSAVRKIRPAWDVATVVRSPDCAWVSRVPQATSGLRTPALRRGGFETRPYMRLARCDAAQPRSPVTRSRMELCAPSGLQAAPELEP
jgi:hypothetical protein